MTATIVQSNSTPYKRVDVDTVTVDIIENALRNVREEMDAVLFRTAMSPGIREQGDCFPMMSHGLTGLTDEFDRQHEQLFTFAHGKDHEIVMLRAVVKAQNKGMAEITVAKSGAPLDDAKIHDTKFYYEGAWHDAVIFDREKLAVGAVIPGPAIVQEMDSTTLILPGHAATVDDIGNLLINPVN